MASSALLAVQNITKRFGAQVALRHVWFEVRPGEVLGLIGPNGAGKTTLFECVAGLLPADEGQVVRHGATDAPLFYVPDGITPWPQQPVAWALDFAVRFLGGDASRMSGVIERLDLAPVLTQRIGTLSKGQRKRVLVALGLLMPHPVLLIDEPFDGLDLRQARQLMAVLRLEADAGRALVLSIHQLTQAARMCDRFLLLSGGHVRGDGTLAGLAAESGTAPDLEEVFLART